MLKPIRTWITAVCLVPLATNATWATPGERGHAQIQVLPDGALPEGELQGTIGQLADGRMIFATSKSLLLHDGHHTETVPLPCETSVSQVTGQPDGSILVAGPILMAIARPNETGGWSWEELRAAPLDEHGNRERVWATQYRVLVLPDEVIAVGWNSGDASRQRAGVRRNGQWLPWNAADDDRPIRYILSETTAYELSDDRVLRRWTDGKWAPDRTLSEPIEPGIVHLSELPGGRLLMIDQRAGFSTAERDGTVQRRTHSDRASSPRWINGICSLGPDGFVAMDDDHRLHVLRPDGTKVTTIDSTTGLPPGGISGMFVDRSGNIWIHNGWRITRIALPGAVSRFDRFNGLGSASVHALVKFAGVLYAGTDAGVYRLQPGDRDGGVSPARFQLLPGPNARTAAFLVHQGQLLAGSDDGVFVLRNDRFERIADGTTRVTELTPDPTDPRAVRIASPVENRLLRKGSDGWHPVDFPRRNLSSTSLLQTGADEWWSVTGSGIIHRYRAFPRIPQPHADDPSPDRRFLAPMAASFMGRNWVPETFHNLPVNRLHAPGRRLLRWGDTPLAVDDRGMWILTDPPRNAALLDPITRAEIAGPRRLRSLAPTSPTRAWIALAPDPTGTQNGLGWQVREIEKHAARPRRILPVEATAVGEIHALLFEPGADGDVLWVGGEHGLQRVELNRLANPAPPAAPRLRAIGALTHAVPPRVPSNHESLGFEFSTPDFPRAGATAYRSRLARNGTEEWTRYTLQPTREFARLSPGDYCFEVQARNADGLTSPASATRFSVAPPWWFSPWGGLIGLTTAAGLIAGGVRWAVWRGRAREQHLEQLVATRTATLRASEAQLSAAKTQAEAANRAKSTFLAAMSHELRTPLNAILGFAQIVRREEGLSAKGKQQLQTIGRNGQHLLQMINEVLDLSKIEADKMVLRPTPCSLHRLAAGLAETFETRASSQGLTFLLEFGAGVPRPVMADEPKLRQVLINLLANAVKFTRTGHVVLAIGWHHGRAHFEVRDTGIGIPAHDLAAVFEPFHQAPVEPNAEHTETGGTGLGLPISQRIVKLMGGKIAVESTVGRGSRFHFDLALEPASATETQPPATRITGYEGPRRRVLIVDDVATNRAVLTDLLTPLDFTVEAVPDGAAALAAHAAQPADLVLLDLHLPDIDGTAVARRLRAQPDRPRLIVVSASVFGIDDMDTDKTGGDAFVPKPVDEAILLAAVAEQLHLRWIRTPDPDSHSPFAPPDAPFPSLSALERPADADLQAWLELARQAELVKLRAALAAVPADAPGAVFRQQLDQLARRHRTGAIRQILTQALVPPLTPPPS